METQWQHYLAGARWAGEYHGRELPISLPCRLMLLTAAFVVGEPVECAAMQDESYSARCTGEGI
jgi:hypothetical protein